MNENIKSFLELTDSYDVVIPMIQRDYAYGRIGEEEKRDHFLKNIKLYLENENAHELDFIYGSVNESNCLILLDGQQRITTLFLLHWYLSLIKDKNGNHHFSDFSSRLNNGSDESKFSYKTRFSSTDFCNALIILNFYGINYVDKYVSIIEENNDTTKLSEVIKNEKWFLPHWNYDPTIINMLNMLDSIKTHFKSNCCQDYYEKLAYEKKIVFNFFRS